MTKRNVAPLDKREDPYREDVIYWYSRVLGSWNEACFDVWPEYRSAAETLASLRQMGYVAWIGKRSIGAPEGAPSAQDFAAVGMEASL